jgi:hypothetical protein
MKERIMKTGARDVKALGPEEEAARERTHRELLRLRELQKQRLRDENVLLGERLARAGAQGRDVKKLTPGEQAARQRLKELSQQNKARLQSQLSSDNHRQLLRLRSANSRVGSVLSPEEEYSREMHRLKLQEEKVQRQQEVASEIVELLRQQCVLGRGGEQKTVAGRWKKAARFARLWREGEEAAVVGGEESDETLGNRSI